MSFRGLFHLRTARFLPATVVALWLTCFPHHAQAQAAKVTIHRVLPGTNTITVVLEVVDQSGVPVAELTASDVVVDIESAERSSLGRVIRYVDSGLPFGTLILIDTSRSMGRSIDNVKLAAHAWANGMEGGDQAIVAQFKDRVLGLEQGWSKDTTALKAQVDALVADGNSTHLYEALNRGIELIGGDPSAPPLRTVLVLSDGKDVGSPPQFTYDRARDLSTRYDVPISAVGFVPNPRDDATGSLSTLAKDTHGRYTSADNSSQLKDRFRAVQDAIHQLWLVEVKAEHIPAGSHGVVVKIGIRGQQVSDTARLDLKKDWDQSTTSDPDAVPESDKDDLPTWVFPAVGGSLLLLVVLAGFLLRKRRIRRELIAAEALQRAEIARQAQAEAERLARYHAQQLAEEPARSARVAPIDDGNPVPERGPHRPQPPSVDSINTGRRGTVFVDPNASPPVYLELLDGPRQGQILVLNFDRTHGEISIGSDPGRVDFVIDDETISGRHARFLRRADGPLQYEDLGSTNGSYLGTEDLRRRGPVQLANDIILQIGMLKVRVRT